ncbi:RNA polymerase sigma factor [Metabacillus malikii]|uniref:RNA polymerase sigma-70 factor (ECF subfamily) n=1 Tax=Metabacillus malikii TaxID=1504265 RepID=A0ABT9ZGJ0_9BACI|nr:sigma-70 family RNA polymerase sigma factor [Metabacillus malikii]MDQ0231398.1 RNA polymerase sigma-70 factor (ECF subfamily) [Metabacillus malikii]
MENINKLVKKAKKGDSKAFLKLYQQYEQDIYRMAFVYVKNKDDALDVVQEVAYRSFKSIGSLQKTEYLKTWLLKITIRCAIDCLNKTNKIVPLKPENEPIFLSDDQHIPLSLSLQELIEKLSPDEKSIVLLKYYEDYTFSEIAEILHIPLGTAKSILYRALQKLRKHAKEVDMYE